MILTKAQAQAAYMAMCALNIADGKANSRFQVGSISGIASRDYLAVFEALQSPKVIVTRCVDFRSKEREEYENQSAFAAAYELEQS